MTPQKFVPLGYEQITALTSAKSLSVPAGATHALFNAEVANVRWRDDGTAPTAALGMILEAQQTGVTAVDIFYGGPLSAIQFIGVSAGAILNVSYYRAAG